MPARTPTGPATAPAPTAVAAGAEAAGDGYEKTRRRASHPCGLNRRIHDMPTLLFIRQANIADIKFVHRGAHDAPQRVRRCADDGLAAHVVGRFLVVVVSGLLLVLAFLAFFSWVR